MVCNILICVLITLVLVFSYREAALRRQLRIALAQTAREAPADERFHSIVENAVEGIFQSTLDGRYLHVNPALARLYGYETPQDLMNNLHNIAKDLYVDPNRRNEFQSLLQEQDFVRDFESQVYQKNGNLIWIVENARGVRDSQGTLLYYEGSVIDTTQRKHAEEQLVYQALHDSLTGLPNRLLFQERLHQAILRSTREQLGVAVLFVDLDDFKLINDSMGHEAGDTLLKTISERLQHAIRREDTIARIGGDEFIVLLERLNSVQEATHIADRIVLELQNPIRLYEREVFTSASIGIAYSSDGQLHSESLLRDADTAMYQAKTHHKSSYILFDPKMNTSLVERLEIEMGMRFALERGEFRLHYQPLIDLESNIMSGVEALLRWEHPTQGLIPPSKFIQIAEDTGLIVPIGYWVLEEACRQMKEWRTEYPNNPIMTVNVNLSGKQLQRPDVVAKIADALKKSGFPAGALKLEITESVMMTDFDSTLTKLNALKELGIKLAMDDFGTGYSSIASLSTLPLDAVKIDRAFVSRLTEHEETQSALAAIIMLSKALHLNVTGEGIETVEQRHSLQNLGCHIGQGYLFAKPLPPALLSQHPYFTRAVTERSEGQRAA